MSHEIIYNTILSLLIVFWLWLEWRSSKTCIIIKKDRKLPRWAVFTSSVLSTIGASFVVVQFYLNFFV